VKRCLVINPNTTVAVTEMVLSACRRAQPALQWEGATARFGAAYIADEVAYAKAAHAALDALEAFHRGHDAVLLACFGDPGLLALRELASVPVVGLAQSSFEAAARRGRFAVVTGGRAWGPMLARFARMHGLDAQLTGIHTIDWTGAQIAADPEGAREALAAAARLGVAGGAECVLLGGAALTGLADVLQPHLSVPVLDNVLLAAQAVGDALRIEHAA
jgi:Asp/Glu/hydantoin racemase